MTTREAKIDLARLRKAELLADVLERAGALAVDVALLDAAGRRAAEGLADVSESSDTTWAMVADVLSARAMVKARIAELAADPFAPFGGAR